MNSMAVKLVFLCQYHYHCHKCFNIYNETRKPISTREFGNDHIKVYHRDFSVIPRNLHTVLTE